MAAGRVKKLEGCVRHVGVGHPSLDCAQNLILHILAAGFIPKYRKKCQHEKEVLSNRLRSEKNPYTMGLQRAARERHVPRQVLLCGWRPHL